MEGHGTLAKQLRLGIFLTRSLNRMLLTFSFFLPMIEVLFVYFSSLLSWWANIVRHVVQNKKTIWREINSLFFPRLASVGLLSLVPGTIFLIHWWSHCSIKRRFLLFFSGGGGIFGGSTWRKVSRTSRNSSVIPSPFSFKQKEGLKFRGTGKFPRLIVDPRQRTAKYFETDRFTAFTAVSTIFVFFI